MKLHRLKIDKDYNKEGEIVVWVAYLEFRLYKEGNIIWVPDKFIMGVRDGYENDDMEYSAYILHTHEVVRQYELGQAQQSLTDSGGYLVLPPTEGYRFIKIYQRGEYQKK